MFDAIAKFIKVLNSETEPGQISLAFCLAMVVALTPLWSAHNLLVLLTVLVLRVNLSTFITSWVVLSAIAYLLDPIFHRIGLALLTAGSLEGLWTALYNTAWFRLDKLNNTVVMGSAVVCAVLFFPVYFAGRYAVVRYREKVLAWARKTRLAQIIKASKLYSAYQTLSGWGGAA